MSRTTDDELLSALRFARPSTSAAAQRPDLGLFARIIAQPAPSPTARRPRLSRWLAVPIAAAAVTAVVFVDEVQLDRGGVSVTPAPPAAADVRQIATSSAAALRSGRALLTYVGSAGEVTEQRVTGTIAFAGDDLEMVMQFAPVAGRGSGFEAQNRTVDGTFYLYDGPPDARRWYRDTASTSRGTELFTVDPRSLLELLHPAVAFEVVEPGVVRHLRATRLDAMPSLNLSLGPLDPAHVRALDIWVGRDDVVRRLELRLLQVETVAQPPIGITKTPDGKVEQTVRADATELETVTREVRSSYSIAFTDVGAPVSIVAPAGAVDVHAQG